MSHSEGDILCGYRLIRQLGEGGMGSVWEAEQAHLGRRVALKIVAAGTEKQEDLRTRFFQEARASAKVEHPNVVQVLDFEVTDDGEPLLVMELLRGESLEERLLRDGPLSLDDARALMTQGSAALAAAHAVGVLHRDIKADNFFVVEGADLKVKLFDFGIARQTSAPSHRITGPPEGVAFASETKALHAREDTPRELHLLSLARYLSFSYVPGEATLLAGVRALPPGTAIELDARGDERSRIVFFRPEEPADLAAREEELARDETQGARYATTLRAALDDVVEGHLAATDELGVPAAFLSGGVDSSLVVALAARLGRTPECFSIAFGDDVPNELEWSKLVADHVGAKHHVLTLDAHVMREALEETAYLLDDPIGDPLTVPNVMLARAAAASGFRRVLNGEGGDPCFGGPKNVPMLLASWYGDEPRERAYARAYARFFDELPALLVPGVLPRRTQPVVQWRRRGSE